MIVLADSDRQVLEIFRFKIKKFHCTEHQMKATQIQEKSFLLWIWILSLFHTQESRDVKMSITPTTVLI